MIKITYFDVKDYVKEVKKIINQIVCLISFGFLIDYYVLSFLSFPGSKLLDFCDLYFAVIESIYLFATIEVQIKCVPNLFSRLPFKSD